MNESLTGLEQHEGELLVHCQFCLLKLFFLPTYSSWHSDSFRNAM